MSKRLEVIENRIMGDSHKEEEIEKRETSVIIHGLKKSPSTEAEERKEDDVTCTQDR
jgi:hypothetical protein